MFIAALFINSQSGDNLHIYQLTDGTVTQLKAISNRRGKKEQNTDTL
jgi:hypothetical protein